MILLVTPQSRGPEFAASLLAATSQETHWARTLQEAGTRLREQSYSAAVIDQFLLETDPEESDQVLEHLGTAFPVYVNFALTGMERLLREVRSALHRRKREESAAKRAVAAQMHSDKRDAHCHASLVRTGDVPPEYAQSGGRKDSSDRHSCP